MLDRIRLSNRPHFDTIAYLASRDMPLQIAMALFLAALCFYLGQIWVAVGVAMTAILSEGSIFLLSTRRAPFGNLTKDSTALWLLGLCAVNTVVYLVPAISLAAAPSLALKVTGLLWVMGVQVYVSNTWSRVPAFLYSLLLPAMLMMVIVFFALPRSAPDASSMTHWGIAFTFVVIFIYSSIDTLRKHMSNEAALFHAERKATARLAQLEETQRLDLLTGLLNRAAFDVSLHIMLTDRISGGGEVSVFLVDLDSFKPINDTYSHEAGDHVLVETARRLNQLIGQAGIVGRLGGDEFICAVQDCENTDAALDLARGLSRCIAAPIEWKGRVLKIGASIGVAVTGDGPQAPSGTVPALCSAADQAMFASKSSPNRAPVVYQADLFAPRMTADDKQMLIESISNETLRPHYQPKIHLPSGRIIGFEALARWEHDGSHIRHPSEFLDQIHELGLQGDFMTSMTRQVVRDVGALIKMGLDPGQVSINVPEVALATQSGRQDLHDIVAADPEVAKHLTFEITEDVFIARAADTIQASICAFRNLGIRISLDDFGTGFASFHHLRQLDFDELKIDTSFVAGLGHGPTAEVLVRGFLNIASGLGVSVVAEGVETQPQSQELQNMGCLIAQGYLFSEAVPLAQATDLLLNQPDCSAAL